jgi:hypothetical protein
MCVGADPFRRVLSIRVVLYVVEFKTQLVFVQLNMDNMTHDSKAIELPEYMNDGEKPRTEVTHGWCKALVFAPSVRVLSL